ncbi:uncharacterized protein LOC115234221 [Formica exsecta]|uniref:uncharacterized protein LOC115234221 n=1 Tax=Formica exsecta TaxID=72781 RepID=UPI001142D293|nr:uncharacterized protein LOC115234221 [Formica exsecta]
MNKLKAWAPPVTESLEPQVLEEVLGALFPSEGPPFDASGRQEATIPWSEDLEVTEEEMAGVIRRLRLRGNKAPGPDGIPGRVWVLALAQLSGRLRRLFNSCLREGVFPPAWVRARLVLIPKGGKPSNAPSAYRPICLLDEAGKLLERVLKYLGLYLDAAWSFGGHFELLAPRAESVALSLSRLLPNLGGPDGRVRRLYANTVQAVALYGSPVWADALVANKRGSMLLRRVFRRVAIRVVRGYRTVSYTAASLLAGMPPVELYADMYAHVYARTRELGGLGVVLTPKVKAAVRLQARRRALERLKYLGLYLDAAWSFGGHFELLAPRAESVALSLSRLLPNLGGPDGRVRRLYANTVRAVTLYGSPVWADALVANKRGSMLLRRVFRRVAIRVVRGYRTVSYTAASLLAGMPPVELYADMYAHGYLKGVVYQTIPTTPEDMKERKHAEIYRKSC